MRKLLQGIVEFRRTRLASYRATFARLALGQRPDALFIACSDSRVVPNLFASTDPGDLFVLRNPGNLVPHYDPAQPERDHAAAAALEFALEELHVHDIVVCGHSSCGAMQALLGGRAGVAHPHLRAWLRHGEEAVAELRAARLLAPPRASHDALSQCNVLVQLQHLRSYPAVERRCRARELRLHAWWFDIAAAEVRVHDPARGFVVLDEAETERQMRLLEANAAPAGPSDARPAPAP